MSPLQKQLTYLYDPFAVPAIDTRQPTEAYLVDKLRKKIYEWRKDDYKGASDISQKLLSHWFYRDHLVDGRTFKYFFCQREAIETLIYLYEVKKIRTLKELQPFYSERMDKQFALDLFKD